MAGQSGWDAFWSGADYQIGADYTGGQQGLANTAWDNAANAVTAWKPNTEAATNYANYLKTINPGTLFSNVSKPDQYNPFIQAAMSDAGTSYQALAEQQGTTAANQAASSFNLNNGLYSGAAAKSIAEGAAAPMAQANVNLANLKSSLMSSLLGQNLASQGQELGLQSAGQAGLYQGAQNTDQMALNQALGLGQTYQNQAGSYDTQAMFGQGAGALDFLNTAAGVAGAAGSLFGGGAPSGLMNLFTSIFGNGGGTPPNVNFAGLPGSPTAAGVGSSQNPWNTPGGYI